MCKRGLIFCVPAFAQSSGSARQLVVRYIISGLVVIFLSVPSSAQTPPPDELVVTAGQPVLAVWKGRHESFALGCGYLLNRWSGVPVRSVAPENWAGEMSKNPVVADLNCDVRTKQYGNTDPLKPGSIVIAHRDGKLYRHKIDSPGFYISGTGTVEQVSDDYFETIGVTDGIELRSFEKPKPDPCTPVCIIAVQICKENGHIDGICFGFTASF